MGLDDLREVIPHGVDVILIPKCESIADVSGVAQAISTVCAEVHRKNDVFLLPIIESARGIVNAFQIASASETICGLAIGLEDYCADIGVVRTREGRESAYARASIVNAACAAGVQPLDSVFSDITDMAALKTHAIESKALGFKGMGCIHPRQIRIIHDAFAPEQREIEKAQLVVQAFDSATKTGSGVTVLDGKMIDMPVVLQAQRTLTLAEQLGLVATIQKTKGKDRIANTNNRKDDGNAEY
jgi:citrate lyase subunit beta/citryl-CoA lyase